MILKDICLLSFPWFASVSSVGQIGFSEISVKFMLNKFFLSRDPILLIVQKDYDIDKIE